jgi:hypothetical protein
MSILPKERNAEKAIFRSSLNNKNLYSKISTFAEQKK